MTKQGPGTPEDSTPSDVPLDDENVAHDSALPAGGDTVEPIIDASYLSALYADSDASLADTDTSDTASKPPSSPVMDEVDSFEGPSDVTIDMPAISVPAASDSDWLTEFEDPTPASTSPVDDLIAAQIDDHSANVSPVNVPTGDPLADFGFFSKDKSGYNSDFEIDANLHHEPIEVDGAPVIGTAVNVGKQVDDNLDADDDFFGPGSVDLPYTHEAEHMRVDAVDEAARSRRAVVVAVVAAVLLVLGLAAAMLYNPGKSDDAGVALSSKNGSTESSKDSGSTPTAPVDTPAVSDTTTTTLPATEPAAVDPAAEVPATAIAPTPAPPAPVPTPAPAPKTPAVQAASLDTWAKNYAATIRYNPVKSGSTWINVMGNKSHVYVVTSKDGSTYQPALTFTTTEQLATNQRMIIADVTGDKSADFIIPLAGASSVDSVVLSSHGGGWHLIPFAASNGSSIHMSNVSLTQSNVVISRGSLGGNRLGTVTWAYSTSKTAFVPIRVH